VADIIQIRRDTAANWTSANPTLANGEMGLETDTGKLKVGDGTTAWTSVSYYTLGTVGTAQYADATANFTGDLQKGGSTVPALGDTTANFTGTLQQGGSNVVVDSDIGSTVQAHDANLTSFLGAVDLPVADGSADQILKTDGSGTVSFGDAAAGGGATYAPTAGTEAYSTHYKDFFVAQGWGACQSAAGSSYLGVFRSRDATATNKAKSNRFIIVQPFDSTQLSRQAGVYNNGFSSASFSVVPSTRTVTWDSTAGGGTSDWYRFWNYTGYNGNIHSTQQYFSIAGGGQVSMNGNIVWSGYSSHQFVVGTLAWGANGAWNDQNTAVGSGQGLHHSNGSRLTLPIDDSASGYGFNTGYNQQNSMASFRVITYTGSATAPLFGNITTCQNTSSSTVEKVNMINQPGIYPSSSYDYPVDICRYNVGGTFSAQTLNYQGTASGEITTGFDRSSYQCLAFLLRNASGVPVVMMYDTNWQASLWTNYSTAPTFFPNVNRHWRPKHGINYGGRGGFVATGVENEFICFDSEFPYYDYYTGQNTLKKFKIDPTNGKFTDIYYCNIDNSVSGWWTKQVVQTPYELYGLYGDDGNSSTITHFLVIRKENVVERNQFGAQVIDLPAASDWIAYPAN
tara:strand:+ start:13958 stop:15829 length:1872 start_codon:yes stop_codon:yes gene_type:complete